jgi:hypothetical protein
MLDGRLNMEKRMWKLDVATHHKAENFQLRRQIKLEKLQSRAYLEIEIKRKEKKIITTTEKTIAKTVGRGIPLLASSRILSEKISVLQKPENKFKVSQHSASVKLKLQPSDLSKLEQVSQFNQHVFGNVVQCNKHAFCKVGQFNKHVFGNVGQLQVFCKVDQINLY